MQTHSRLDRLSLVLITLAAMAVPAASNLNPYAKLPSLAHQARCVENGSQSGAKGNMNLRFYQPL